MKEKKKYYLLFFDLLLIVGILVNTISNHTITYSVVKVSVSFSIIIFLIIDKLFTNIIFSESEKIKLTKSFLLKVGLLVFPLSLSVLYSLNAIYGLFKLFDLVFGVLPVIFALFLYFSSKNFNLNLLLIAGFSIALFFAAILIFTNPFQFGISYTFSFSRFSHVLLGRYLSFFAIVCLILILIKGFEKKYVFIFIMLALGAGFSFHRSSILGLLLSSFTLLIYNYLKTKKCSETLVLLGIIIISMILVLGSSSLYKPDGFRRIENLMELKIENDGPAIARKEGSIVALQMISEKPIFGRGFGGYNSDFKNFSIQNLIKYPHNIFLEYLVETGIIGLILFGVLLFQIINPLKNNFNLSVIFFFTLWLALFSKDISTQILLWIFIPLSEKKILKILDNQTRYVA